MTVNAQAQALAKAGRRLQEEAQGHMRLSRQHRKRAATLYRELDELIANCREYGIQLDIRSLQAPITLAGVTSEHSTSEAPQAGEGAGKAAGQVGPAA
jgi:hypothetical protein